jgi:hypothetical protein
VPETAEKVPICVPLSTIPLIVAGPGRCLFGSGKIMEIALEVLEEVVAIV